MPTKIYRIKINDLFRLVLATVLLITTSKNNEIESAKNEINAFKSQQVQCQKSQKDASADFQASQIFGHFN